MGELDIEWMSIDAVRTRAFELSQEAEAGTPEENWLRAERELGVAYDYDTVDRDLEQLGMTLSRLPSEAGIVWRLSLPRGEHVEAWEPGNAGLFPPREIMQLLEGVARGKQLVPSPPVSREPGALRVREMIDTQRRALVTNDPGTRLGIDPENLHEHRVAARRTRAFLRAGRRYFDPAWYGSLTGLLQALGERTSPVRDLDVLLEHVQNELAALEEPDRPAGDGLLICLERERDTVRRSLLEALAGDDYRILLARLRLPPRLASEVAAVPLERIARKEFRRLVKAVDQLGKKPEVAAIHGLRITLKRARYAAELSTPKGESGRRFLADARALQDMLGEHQDAVVAEQHLRAATVVDERTAIAFVAGRIAERQVERRARVLERLPVAWKRLRKSGHQL